MIFSERALIFAPAGRDAAVAAALLKEASRDYIICESAAALTAALYEGAGVAIIADDAIVSSDLQCLSRWIEQQPTWSDFPFILLTKRGGGVERNPLAKRMTHLFGNVIFLERPFHPTTLISAVDTALRGRRRQYQARSHLTELEEAKQRLTTALRAGSLGEWELDLLNYQLTASGHCKENFGHADDNAPFGYEAVLASIHPEDRPRMEQTLRRCIISGSDYAIECRVIWPDDSCHWLELRARVVRDSLGMPRSAVGVSSDITDRVIAVADRERLYQELSLARERTQEALRGEKAFTGLLMTSVPAGIVAYGPDLAVSTWNPVMQELFGLSESEAIGGKLADILNSGQADKILARMKQALAGEICSSEEMEFRRQGSAPNWICEIQHAPLSNGDRQIVGGVAFFRDITERRRAEEQLRQAQKMETIGQLTGGIAHDFNNLLMAVLGNLDLLRKKTMDDQNLKRHVDGAIQGAQRGAALTQRLLAFARRQDLRPQSVDLAQLVEGMRSLIDRSLGPLIVVDMDVPKGLPAAAVDANQLELAILNLAVNARDAMPDGGELKFALTEAEAPAKLGLAAKRYLRLAVTDNGTGMDSATLRSAIEPFFSTKELGKGTGLGLSMVHGLAVQSGGVLQLSSVLGEGTVAELWLPVADAPVTPQAKGDMLTTDAPISTILVVDDDALIAMSTVDMIEDLGHKVIEANSGAEALAILQGGAEVDAIVTDHAMPGMTGVELAAKARALRPQLPILLATGYADLPAGTSTDLPRLSKPYQQAELSVQLSKLLQSA